MLLDNKKIFWDMDETLGFFQHISYELQKIEVPDYFPHFMIKEGIQDLLQELKEDGAENYLTTSAPQMYVDEVLKRTDLKKYFKQIFTKHDTSFINSPSKEYAKVIRYLNITKDKAKSDIVIIGDSEFDSPCDITEIISIIDRAQYLRKAELTKTMINMLLETGNGDFSKGFHELYNSSEKLERTYDFLPHIGLVKFKDEAEFHLKFQHERHNDSGAPMFEVKRADKYFTSLIKVET